MNSSEYMRQYMAQRYQERLQKAIEHLGGKCACCPATMDLQFDHTDPASKSFTITDRLDSRPWEEVLAELEKCQLLCRSCHSLKSIKEAGHTPAKGTHGTLSSYRYCKCDECRAAYNSYMREYKKKRRDAITG